jgi:NAD(P)-dependent dehydrogenase (short-subunit alcohol dehydrogenase family)
MIDLLGRCAVVTGAARGIGQATAATLAAAGALVCCVDLDAEEARDAWRRSVPDPEAQVLFVQADVADDAAVQACADRVVEAWGRLDIWVNNASRMVVKPFLEITDAEWRGLLDVNLFGYRNGCRAALRHMAPARTGTIVNVASVTAIQPLPLLSAYVTGKGGVVGLTKALAVEFGPLGVRINAVSPGVIETPLNTGVAIPEVREAYERKITLGRIGQPRDIAGVVAFLASDLAGYICGEDLLVDGGLAVNGKVA